MHEQNSSVAADAGEAVSPRHRALGVRWLIAGAIFSFVWWTCWPMVSSFGVPATGWLVLLALPPELPAFVGGLYVFSAYRWPWRILAAYALSWPTAGIPGVLGGALGLALSRAF